MGDLTDKELKNLKPRAKLYKVTDRDGMHAAVTLRILAAALCNPLSLTAVRSTSDALVALAALAAQLIWRVPPLLIVLGCAAASVLLSGLPPLI